MDFRTHWIGATPTEKSDLGNYWGQTEEDLVTLTCCAVFLGKRKTNKMFPKPNSWSAANGGVTNGGLRGVWPPVLEIGQNRPFSPFFCLFHPFPEGPKSTWKIQKTEEKGLFPQISSDLLKPPSLKPPFAALQNLANQLSAIPQGQLDRTGPMAHSSDG